MQTKLDPFQQVRSFRKTFTTSKFAIYKTFIGNVKSRQYLAGPDDHHHIVQKRVPNMKPSTRHASSNVLIRMFSAQSECYADSLDVVNENM